LHAYHADAELQMGHYNHHPSMTILWCAILWHLGVVEHCGLKTRTECGNTLFFGLGQRWASLGFPVQTVFQRRYLSTQMAISVRVALCEFPPRNVWHLGCVPVQVE